MKINPSQPTGQGGRISRFNAEIARRCTACHARAAEYVAALGAVVVQNRAVYQYETDPYRISQLNDWLVQMINEELYGNYSSLWTAGWWANHYMSGAYRDGTNRAIRSAKEAVIDAKRSGYEIDEAAAVKAISIETVMRSPQYQRRLTQAYGRVYESMLGLTEWMKSDMAGIITRGMAAGKSPREIAKEISERTGVSKSRGLRIARTEVNTTYNMATKDETDEMNRDIFSDSSYELAMIHISAKLPTTRMDHARRHGKVSSTQEQAYWWDYVASGGRINCYCSTANVMRDKETGEALNKGLLELVKED